MTTGEGRVVSLDCLCAGDAPSIETAVQFLKKDGFIFLDLTRSNLLSPVLPIFQDAGVFLQGPSRGEGSCTELHGHISGKFKDSLRFLSGNQYETSPVAGTDKLVRVLDEAAIKVAEALAQPLFQLNDARQVGEKYSLPLLHPEPRNQQAYGLVDIVCYHNDDPTTPNIIVSAHHDPGLFVIALPQLVPGLELLDTTMEKWVSPPKGMGVIWAGRAASDCLAPCLHRVRRHETPRVACWHEICTADQISAPFLRRLKEDQQQLALGDTVVGTQKVLNYLRRAENHELDTGTKGPVKAVNGSTGNSFVVDAQFPSPDGMPVSKTAGFVVSSSNSTRNEESSKVEDLLKVEPVIKPGLLIGKVETEVVQFPVRTNRRGVRLPGGFQWTWKK